MLLSSPRPAPKQQPRISLTTRRDGHAVLLIAATARRTLDEGASDRRTTISEVWDAVIDTPAQLPPSTRPAVRAALRKHDRAIVSALFEHPSGTPSQIANWVLAG
jgi:hypothetical protein